MTHFRLWPFSTHAAMYADVGIRASAEVGRRDLLIMRDEAVHVHGSTREPALCIRLWSGRGPAQPSSQAPP